MDCGPLRFRARPTSLVVEAPIVKPTLMPETVKGYLWPRSSRTPSPPPTPTMNPPLVKTTATWPVSACDGVLKPALISRAVKATRMATFLMRFVSSGCYADLLSQYHREVAKHGEQNARYGVADWEPDPGHGALDFHRGFAARTGVRPRTGNAAHQHGRIDLEDVEADRPDDERRDRAGDEASDEDLQRDRTRELRQQPGAGIDADDGDEDHEAEILQHIARRVRCVAEEAQSGDQRRDDHAGQQQSA